jgi:MFS family permease
MILASGTYPENSDSSSQTALADGHSTALERYGELLRRPDVAPLLGASVLARLPTGIMGLGWIFLVREFASYASAGMVLSVFAVTSGIAVVVQGRLIDRVGQTPVLTLCAAAFPLGLALSLFAASRSWLPGVVAAAIAAGFTMPAVAACLRSLFPGLVEDSPSLVRTAYGLDNALQETLYMIGPLLVSWLATSVHANTPLIVAGVSGGVGTAWFASRPSSRQWRGDRVGPGDWIGSLRSPGIRVIVGATFLFGLSFGLLYLAVPALLENLSALGSVGLAFAAIAAATIGSSLWFGGLKWRMKTHVVFVASLGLLAIAIAVSGLASSPWQLVLFMVVVGSAEGLRITSANQLVGRLSPPATTTEAFTWLNAATVGGSAVGLLTAGALLALLTPADLLVLGGVIAALGASLAFAGHRVLSAEDIAGSTSTG